MNRKFGTFSSLPNYSVNGESLPSPQPHRLPGKLALLVLGLAAIAPLIATGSDVARCLAILALFSPTLTCVGPLLLIGLIRLALLLALGRDPDRDR
jgi:hypothetical protein